MRDPTNPFAPLDNAGWMSMDERKNAADRIATLEAKLREAVEWVRKARKWCQEGLSGQHERLAEQALERIHEATGDFLATIKTEKTDGK